MEPRGWTAPVTTETVEEWTATALTMEQAAETAEGQPRLLLVLAAAVLRQAADPAATRGIPLGILARLGLPPDPEQATDRHVQRVERYLEAVRLAVVELSGIHTDRDPDQDPVDLAHVGTDLADLMPWLRDVRRLRR
jgi:hypothetical protein